MLAAVYHGPEDLRLEEVPVPEIGADEVLIKVAGAGICGTDLSILHGKHRDCPPGTVRIPGHEMEGIIDRIGSQVEGYSVGQRVFVAPNVGCGQCLQCISGSSNLCLDYDGIGVTIDGAFARYMRVPAAAIEQGNILPVADRVEPGTAALIEPLACVLRGQNAVNVGVGDTVVVIGFGPIGVLHTMLARLSGAALVVVSEVMPERLALAERFGADRGVDPGSEDLASVVDRMTRGRGADVVIIAAPSHQAQEMSLQIAGIGGRINFFGALPKNDQMITIDSNLVHYKKLIVTANSACSTGDCWQAADIVNSGRLDLSPLVSARFPLEKAADAFAAAENKKYLKIILEP